MPPEDFDLPFNVIDNSSEGLRVLPEIYDSHTVIPTVGPHHRMCCSNCDLTGYELVVMPCEPPNHWWTTLGYVRQ